MNWRKLEKTLGKSKVLKGKVGVVGELNRNKA
jgi:hypothetical protein